MAKNSEDLRDDAEGDRALLKLAVERFQENRKVPSSKYDFVKIKVWLGGNGEQEHSVHSGEGWRAGRCARTATWR